MPKEMKQVKEIYEACCLSFRKIGENWTSKFYVVFDFFHPRPVVRCVPELIFPKLGNHPRWEKNSGTKGTTRTW